MFLRIPRRVVWLLLNCYPGLSQRRVCTVLFNTIKSDKEPDGFPLASPHVTDEAWVGRAGRAPDELRTGKG